MFHILRWFQGTLVPDSCCQSLSLEMSHKVNKQGAVATYGHANIATPSINFQSLTQTGFRYLVRECLQMSNTIFVT